MTAIVAVCQRKVDSFIESHIHCSSDKSLNGIDIVIDRILNILNLTAVRKIPETILQILLLNRCNVFGNMAVERIGYIFSVAYTLDNTVFLSELLNLKAAKAFCGSSVDCIEVAVFFLKLVNLFVNVFKYFNCANCPSSYSDLPL